MARDGKAHRGKEEQDGEADHREIDVQHSEKRCEMSPPVAVDMVSDTHFFPNSIEKFST